MQPCFNGYCLNNLTLSVLPTSQGLISVCRVVPTCFRHFPSAMDMPYWFDLDDVYLFEAML